MTFQVGHKTNTPWRRGVTLGSTRLYTCGLAGCGKTFSRKRSDNRGAHVFCSRACSHAFQRQRRAK